MRQAPSGFAALVTATVVLSTTGHVLGQTDTPRRTSPAAEAEARSVVVEILQRASPREGSVRAHYQAAKSPGRTLVLGLDLRSGAWFDIQAGNVHGMDAAGAYYKGRAQPNAVWHSAFGRNELPLKEGAYVEDAFPQLYPRFLAQHPHFIERVEKNADGEWVLFMTFPCANWTIALAPKEAVEGCEQKITQLHLDGEGAFVRRGIPGWFQEADRSPDSPPGWPVRMLIGGPDGWRLTGIDWSPTPRPEWFTMQNVEAFAIDNAGDPSDRPLAAQPDGSLARIAADGSRVPVPPVNTAGGTTNWSRWLLSGGGVLATLGLVAWLWQRRAAM